MHASQQRKTDGHTYQKIDGLYFRTSYPKQISRDGLVIVLVFYGTRGAVDEAREEEADNYESYGNTDAQFDSAMTKIDTAGEACRSDSTIITVAQDLVDMVRI